MIDAPEICRLRSKKVVVSEGSSITHSSGPRLFSSALKLFQVLIFCLSGGSQMPKMCSCNLKCESIKVFSWCPYVIVASVHATGVPIAVPKSCLQYVPANVKILFSIMVVST